MLQHIWSTGVQGSWCIDEENTKFEPQIGKIPAEHHRELLGAWLRRYYYYALLGTVPITELLTCHYQHSLVGHLESIPQF